MKEIEYCPDNDCYAILGLGSACDNDAIKKRHKRLCLQLHPDKQPMQARDEAHAAFVRMQNAFELLKNHVQRTTYNRKRNSYYRKLFKAVQSVDRTVNFNDWMEEVQEPIILGEEEERMNSQKVRWSGWCDDAKAKADKENKRKAEEHQQYKKNHKKRKTEEKTNDRKLEVELLEEDARSMAIDFRKWELRQKEGRANEVEGREAEARKQKEQHTKEWDDLLKRQEKERKVQLEELLRLQEQERQTQKKKQERKQGLLRERHRKQSQFQKDDRRQVREEYERWRKQNEGDIQKLQAGLSQSSQKRTRPSFYKHSFGFTKDGRRCQSCLQAGGFCYQHRGQMP